MRIVLAPDKFKGSLSAQQACAAMERGLRRVWPDAQVLSVPLADGGEGTLDALVAATGGRYIEQMVTGPLGDPVRARYGILGDGQTAVIEMAQASGLWLVPTEQRDPLKTTSLGTGQLIRAAVEQGYRRLIVAIGGSATTDCGCGMAQALGVRFLDSRLRPIEVPMTGELMGQVERVDLSCMLEALRECSVVVASDVTNPLLGPTGAVIVYARQKGAKADQLDRLEHYMGHMIDLLESGTGRKVRHVPGAGAAGGLGAALMALLNAQLRPGIEIVMEAVDFEQIVRGSDLLFTGEGKVDAQSGYGKVLSGVLRVARREGIPVVILAGSIEEGAESLFQDGVMFMDAISTRQISLSEAISRAAELLEITAQTAAEKIADGKLL